jgi:hypothetical protein
LMGVESEMEDAVVGVGGSSEGPSSRSSSAGGKACAIPGEEERIYDGASRWVMRGETRGGEEGKRLLTSRMEGKPAWGPERLRTEL